VNWLLALACVLSVVLASENTMAPAWPLVLARWPMATE
jgi:hypothetical protein